MIKPKKFGFNLETANSNAFQNSIELSDKKLQKQVDIEFNELVKNLKCHGIKVNVIDDTLNPSKPDAIFPNNWVSFHDDGKIILYPMMANNRRLEKRDDIIDLFAFVTDATTNPSLLLKLSAKEEYNYLFENAVKYAQDKNDK